MENLAISRTRTDIIAASDELAQMTHFVDQMTVIGLWALAEQYISKIYKQLYSHVRNVPMRDVKSSFSWTDYTREFNVLNLDILTCDNFQNADECRMLNNAMKHDVNVEKKLLRCDFFQPYLNQRLDQIPVEMQRYFNGVSDFLGSLIEKSNAIIETNTA